MYDIFVQQPEKKSYFLILNCLCLIFFDKKLSKLSEFLNFKKYFETILIKF